MRACDWSGCPAAPAAPSAWCREHCPAKWALVELRYSTPPTELTTHYGAGGTNVLWRDEQRRIHRLDGSAELIYGIDGRLDYAMWCVDGQMHREDGPAEVVIDHRGVPMWHERYRRHGKLHRIDGPAEITLHERDGGPDQIGYFVDGKKHRVDGPAEVFYAQPGNRVVDRDFFLMGEKVTAEVVKSYRDAVTSGAPSEWALAFALGEGGS